MKRTINYLLFSCALVFLAACASPGHKALTSFLEKGVNTLSYEDAVRRWHEPEKLTEEDETFTALWVDEDYYLIETPGSAFRAPTLTGRRTILTFKRKTKRLIKYKVEYY